MACYLSSELTSFNQFLATAVVGKNQGKFVCNPSITELDESSFELIITATREKIVMIELEAEEIDEEELNKAVSFAQEQIKQILCFFQQISDSLNIHKKPFSVSEKPIDEH